jgi:hypothetical protein
MFYCVLEGTKVTWYSGIISFSITEEDIKIMYEDAFKRDFQDTFEIIQIGDTDIANKIMTNKATYDGINWNFTSCDELTPEPNQINLEEELFKSQTQLLQTEIDKNDLGTQLFNLQTSLIQKGVL